MAQSLDQARHLAQPAALPFPHHESQVQTRTSRSTHRVTWRPKPFISTENVRRKTVHSDCMWKRKPFISPLQSWLGGLESLVLSLERFLRCFVLFGQVNVSVIACNATGLDAAQRLEHKKKGSSLTVLGSCRETGVSSGDTWDR